MEQGGSVLGALLPLIVFFAIFYFLVMRPQQKQAKAHKAMIDGLSKGDKIISNGGLKCTVVKTNDNFITVKLNDDVIVELDRQYVAKKVEDKVVEAKDEKK
ncbi:preprotein translocase subunit YajC [Campylobacter blaseri]|uniref:Sec translocon accessory complex subunit YajC n=1 Tax=Campylobacter blaseri TaxID=2042961 RepID=A0A2P8R1X7_9BACT|nr:preprotein translocase subunit YajC [Campylobacter blaseri]PSM52505.1 preprotein translocase subunit YajC [Campylobacter blaseri]PSM54153.1 preprotein translocase subunit YajC [Campylobacter blaseri]QKF85801.1 preprotein translocase subunit YajC [Campylobacter blaseri]